MEIEDLKKSIRISIRAGAEAISDATDGGLWTARGEMEKATNEEKGVGRDSPGFCHRTEVDSSC